MRGMKFLSMRGTSYRKLPIMFPGSQRESSVVTPVTVEEGDDVKHGDCC